MKTWQRFILTGLGLGLTACAGRDAKLGRQITGVWVAQDSPWLYNRTISPDGCFTTRIGRSGAQVTYQGTWVVKGGELITTITNAQGMGNHQPGSAAGSVNVGKIIRVEGDELVIEADGKSRTFIR